jgi:hypothetical protein
VGWKLDILGSDGKVFQSFQGKLGDNQPLRWTGVNDNGQAFISNSAYQFRISLLDPKGNVVKTMPATSKLCIFRH